VGKVGYLQRVSNPRLWPRGKPIDNRLQVDNLPDSTPRYAIDMAYWTKIDGRIAGGERIRVYVAALNGRIAHVAMDHAERPCSEAEFLWRLAGRESWEPWPEGSGAGLLDAAATQFEEYFSGRLLEFELPLDLSGTPFQQQVWRALMKIPYGETRSYGDIAEAIRNPGAMRAVGNANGRNHLPIIIPCHRVIAAGGKIGGFGGGVGLKKSLLAHEAAILGRRRLAS
jgi:O-6-methylguanine DNA methyltransferase